MAVTASLVINFGDVDDAYLSAEIVDEDNDGKTSFKAGDEVYFRVYYSGTYDVTQTVGSSSAFDSGIVANIKDINDNGLAEVVAYSFSSTASTSKYIHNFISGAWMGTQPTGKNGNTATIAKVGHAEVSGGFENTIGVAKIDYDTRYDLWKYSSPSTVDGSDTYTVVIGITATS